jgi:exopolyphosphatase/guanosine-5'-triphosphate,3'-diphosphate pyrophosphatase
LISTDPFNVPSSGPDQIGVLDIGSNSIRFVIYDIYGSHFTPVYNEKVLAGLGRGLKETGRLSEDGKRITLDNLTRFQAIAEARGLFETGNGGIRIAATAAMRVAKDAADFIADIHAKTGLDVVPISGLEEARLSALGLLAGNPLAKGIALDLGGASLEIIQLTEAGPGPRVSLPLGPFEFIGADLRGADYRALRPDLEARLDDASLLSDLSDDLAAVLRGDRPVETLHLIGGAWRNLATIHMGRSDYPLRTLQSYRLLPDEAAALAQWAYTNGKAELLDWPGLRAQRAETLPYSGLLLDCLLSRLMPKSVDLSLTGLREGIVFDSLPRAVQMRDALLDGCRDFASGTLQSEFFGVPLMDFIDGIAEALPIAFDPKTDARLRQAACLLAGLGKNLHPDYRAEVVFQNVLYAPIAGLSHPMRTWLALSQFRSVSHSKSAPNKRAVETLLNADQIRSAEVLGSAIRLAIVATGRTPELVSALRLAVEGGTLTLRSDKAALLTEQVTFRLAKLADKLGLPCRIAL